MVYPRCLSYYTVKQDAQCLVNDAQIFISAIFSTIEGLLRRKKKEGVKKKKKERDITWLKLHRFELLFTNSHKSYTSFTNLLCTVTIMRAHHLKQNKQTKKPQL